MIRLLFFVSLGASAVRFVVDLILSLFLLAALAVQYPRMIFLFTDFGAADIYVGQVKTVFAAFACR